MNEKDPSGRLRLGIGNRELFHASQHSIVVSDGLLRSLTLRIPFFRIVLEVELCTSRMS
jgi:hypothetical protein